MREPDLRGKGFQRRFVRPDIPDAVQLGEWRAWDVMPTITPAERAEYPGALGLWTLHAPGSHIIWPWTRLTVVHLRPIPGMPDSVLHFPRASHEFGILAVDPERCPDPNPDDRALKFLRPSNLVHQVTGITDEMATETLRLLVRAMVDGFTSPDEDYRAPNKQLIDGTLEHMKQGRHLPS